MALQASTMMAMTRGWDRDRMRWPSQFKCEHRVHDGNLVLGRLREKKMAIMRTGKGLHNGHQVRVGSCERKPMRDVFSDVFARSVTDYKTVMDA